MDSRLIPEEILGLDVGDAEVIRNGGGRVTMDVLRWAQPVIGTRQDLAFACLCAKPDKRTRPGSSISTQYHQNLQPPTTYSLGAIPLQDDC